ncbi:MAG: META domain-containing protein [Venatoribacter sp.]
MNIKLFAALAASALLSACATTPTGLQADQLQYQKWSLFSIDGVAIASDVQSDLFIGENLKVNGKAGCNRFFGEAKLQGGQFSAPNLATTMMACMGDSQQVENAVLATLASSSTVSLKEQQLILQGNQFTLVYQLQ